MHKANWDVIKHIYILLSPINEITWVTSLIHVSVNMSHRRGVHKFIQWQEPLGLFKYLFSWWDEFGHVVNGTHGLTDNPLYKQLASTHIIIWSLKRENIIFVIISMSERIKYDSVLIILFIYFIISPNHRQDITTLCIYTHMIMFSHD